MMNILMTCRVCSCDVAEEKKKGDKTSIIAQRRSRLATPIATPGGFITPSRSVAAYPPSNQYAGGGYTPVVQPPTEAEFSVKPPSSSPASITPPKADDSFPPGSVSPPSILPTPKQKKLYSKKGPQAI